MSDRRPRGRPPNVDRPQIVADAAIRLLSVNGTRSLSHLRVDKEAGLPAGSTVNIAPTRSDLLLIAARRLIEISMEEVLPITNLLEAKNNSLTPEDVAGEIITLWRWRLGESQIFRLRAEMAIHSSQDMINVKDLFLPYTLVVSELWQEVMVHLGGRNPVESAEEFGIWTRGVYYMLGLRGGFTGEGEEKNIEAGIARLIRSLIDEK